MNDKNKIKDAVIEHYEKLAKEISFVKGNTENITASIGYRVEDIAGIPKEADLGLGCGNPQEAAFPRLNEKLLDLGCGRGIDCFIASKAVGKNGKVFGLDASETMIRRASEIALKNGFFNCEFIQGEIENIPLPDNILDLIISNCVINLSTDKPKVYSEIYRTLRKGGRMVISDITLKKRLPSVWISDLDMVKTWVGGAWSVEQIRAAFEKIGFINVSVKSKEVSDEYAKKWGHGLEIKKYIQSSLIYAEK